MNSLYFKHFLLTALLVLISFIILGFTLASLTFNYLTNEKHDALRVNAETLSKAASVYVIKPDLWSDWYLRMTLSTTARTTNTNIFICDTDGMVVTSSDESIMNEHIGRTIPEYARAEIDRYGSYSGTDTLGGYYDENRYIVGVPVSNGSATAGYVFVSTDSSSLLAVWRSFISIFIITALVVLLLSTILASYTSRRQTKPLNDMADAARRFARGEFGVRVETGAGSRGDEIDQLTSAFNAMADSLEKSELLRREFIANISHELKTPVTTISGYADGILDGTVPEEKQRGYLEIVSAEAKRLSRLIRRMLDISQLQSADHARPPRETFDLNELVCRVLLSLEGKVNARGLDVDADLPEDPVVVRGDSDGINQVVYNLLDNAIKFSSAASVISLRLYKRGDKCHFSVKNNGETIPKEELPLLFDRFHKTDRSRSQDREGVGLGLYIVKAILNNHNEDIAASSENGVTEFRFTLKLA